MRALTHCSRFCLARNLRCKAGLCDPAGSAVRTHVRSVSHACNFSSAWPVEFSNRCQHACLRDKLARCGLVLRRGLVWSSLVRCCGLLGARPKGAGSSASTSLARRAGLRHNGGGCPQHGAGTLGTQVTLATAAARSSTRAAQAGGVGPEGPCATCGRGSQGSTTPHPGTLVSQSIPSSATLAPVRTGWRWRSGGWQLAAGEITSDGEPAGHCGQVSLEGVCQR